MADDTSQKREQIAQFLKQKTQQGKQYFKSKKIAEAVGLSSREVGANLLVLDEERDDLSIEEYANSRSTTWYITQQQAQSPERAPQVAD